MLAHLIPILKALGLMLASSGPYLGTNGVSLSWLPIPTCSAKAAISTAKQAYADLACIYNFAIVPSFEGKRTCIDCL